MYSEYFGFREKPFNVTPDPRFFYANTVYQEAYASLLYGIRERKGFIVLTGEVGTGKTTLLRRLMVNFEESIHFVFFYHTTSTFEELLTFICEDLGLEVAGKGSLQKIQELNNFLLSCLQQGGTGVLLIDEAQNLADDVLENLRLLSNLETSSEKLLQIVLVGQPELEAKLARPQLRQLRQRVAIQARLDGLKDSEIGPFIHHRLRTIGYEKLHLFPQETTQRISMYARGTPRLVNIICDNALLIAYSTNQKIISVDIIEEVAQDLDLKPKSQPVPRDIVGASKGEPPPLPPPVETLPVAKVEVSSPVGDSRESGFRSYASKDAQATPRPRRSWRLNRAGIVLVVVLGATVGAAVVRTQLSPFVEPDVAREPSATTPAQDAATLETVPSLAEPSVEQPTAPQPDSPPESNESKWRNSPLAMRYGTTALEIVAQHYGSYNALAVDLIKEFNPHIENLDRILAGEKLWLPPLTRETLLREQPDGSYTLVVTSVRSSEAAEQFAASLRPKGYVVKVVPRKVSGSLLLYRVEIEKLNDPAAVEQAWQFVDIGDVSREPSVLSDQSPARREKSVRR
jgi:general secretion pathway protein A